MCLSKEKDKMLQREGGLVGFISPPSPFPPKAESGEVGEAEKEIAAKTPTNSQHPAPSQLAFYFCFPPGKEGRKGTKGRGSARFRRRESVEI